MKFAQHFFAFLMGYFIYSLIEIINRGYTHWTMSLTGGFILMILYAINSRKTMTLMKSCFIGSVIITAVEFVVGVFDNIIMNWNVWDYSVCRLIFPDRYVFYFHVTGFCYVYRHIICVGLYTGNSLLTDRFHNILKNRLFRLYQDSP